MNFFQCGIAENLGRECQVSRVSKRRHDMTLIERPMALYLVSLWFHNQSKVLEHINKQSIGRITMTNAIQDTAAREK